MEKSKTPARRQDIPDSRPLLERILATPRQLERVFDLDLWRVDQPGADEHFDAGRFGL
jgi:hypothetical protein